MSVVRFVVEVDTKIQLDVFEADPNVPALRKALELACARIVADAGWAFRVGRLDDDECAHIVRRLRSHYAMHLDPEPTDISIVRKLYTSDEPPEEAPIHGLAEAEDPHRWLVLPGLTLNEARQAVRSLTRNPDSKRYAWEPAIYRYWPIDPNGPDRGWADYIRLTVFKWVPATGDSPPPLWKHGHFVQVS
jgi:hypothetical protein